MRPDRFLDYRCRHLQLPGPNELGGFILAEGPFWGPSLVVGAFEDCIKAVKKVMILFMEVNQLALRIANLQTRFLFSRHKGPQGP